jgi:hypothetical protein
MVFSPQGRPFGHNRCRALDLGLRSQGDLGEGAAGPVRPPIHVAAQVTRNEVYHGRQGFGCR